MVGEGRRCGTTWPTMADDVNTGEMVLFADGALGGEVEAVRFPDGAPAEVDIRITAGGKLGSHKGINLPQTDIQAPALTGKDRADLAVGVAAGVDYVALSFVRHAQDCRELRQLLVDLGAPDMPVVAKIEKPEAVTGIDDILAHVQGLMVARGDLGVGDSLRTGTRCSEAVLSGRRTWAHWSLLHADARQHGTKPTAHVPRSPTWPMPSLTAPMP